MVSHRDERQRAHAPVTFDQLQLAAWLTTLYLEARHQWLRYPWIPFYGWVALLLGLLRDELDADLWGDNA